MKDGDARDSVIILLITCRTYLKCSDQATVAGNGMHSSNLSGLGQGACWAEEVHVCLCVCNMSVVLL